MCWCLVLSFLRAISLKLEAYACMTRNRRATELLFPLYLKTNLLSTYNLPLHHSSLNVIDIEAWSFYYEEINYYQTTSNTPRYSKYKRPHTSSSNQTIAKINSYNKLHAWLDLENLLPSISPLLPHHQACFP
jgi:hypothetical protein